MQRVFVLLPSPHPTGPIKGAYALANALVGEVPVTLVTLKDGPGVDAELDPRVAQHSLAATSGGWWGRVRAYRNLLDAAGSRRNVGSISMCLSADLVNCLAGTHAVTCASVRGNLLKNYRLDYGVPGVPAAVGHLAALRRTDHIVAITRAMAAQVARFAQRQVTVIGNFVDEEALDRYRSTTRPAGSLRFVFVASLTERKQPLLAVRAVGKLLERGVDAHLDVIGTGPLTSGVAHEIARLRLEHAITLHGHVANPYEAIATADVMVLPSLSEGLARSALEALHLGVPCVMRAVDGNSELVSSQAQGALFRDDEDLWRSMLDVAERARAHAGPRDTLLPAEFRQRPQAGRYLELLDRPS